jgi:hypothetical protein
MGVLIIIAVGVLIKQSSYDPGLLVPQVPESQTLLEPVREPPPLPDFADFVPGDMVVLNPVESFGPETLFEKINGKAELYLSAGFFSLRCQRFAARPDSRSWMEAFVYDMGALRRAFAVFSAQRRAGAEPLDFTPFSYSTRNALFWIHGRYYVELISSDPSEAMMASMLSFGKNFVLETSVERETIDELALLPPEHLEETSTTFLISNAFGFDALDNVFTATYHMDGKELAAFLTKRKSTKEAQKIADAYHSFLLENGGNYVPLKAHLADAHLVEILGAFELILRHGQYVAGVHEAQSQETAERLGLMLKSKLAEAVE